MNIYFPYQEHTLPISHRVTKNYRFPQWDVDGDLVEHHQNGKYRRTIGAHHWLPELKDLTRDRLLVIIRDEMKDTFSERELSMLGDRCSPILRRLLKEWHTHYDTRIYDDPYYIFETVSCAIHVTAQITNSKRDTLRQTGVVRKNIMYFNHLGYTPRTILDVGCGIGLSSLYMAHNFPNSDIYVDEKNKLSLRILQRLCDEFNIKNVHIGDKLPRYSCGIFHEVIEHIPLAEGSRWGSPYPWLDTYLERFDDNFTYSTWWQKYDTSIGHFNAYLIDDGNQCPSNSRHWARNFHQSLKRRDWMMDTRLELQHRMPWFFWRGDARFAAWYGWDYMERRDNGKETCI